jgi:copper chaperone
MLFRAPKGLTCDFRRDPAAPLFFRQGHVRHPRKLMPTAGSRFMFWQSLTGVFFMTHKVTLNVSGMTCNGCVKAVEKIVKRADPQAEVAIELEAGKLEATTSLAAEALAKTITEAGYESTVA